MEEIFNQAMDYFQNHNWEKAEELFTQIANIADVESYIKKCKLFRKFSVGGVVPYGTKDGAPMTWRVLEERGNMRLLLCDTIAAEKPYQNLYIDTYWNDSSLRKWLGGEFMTEYFTTEERRNILSVRNDNLANEDFFTNGGPKTMDKVFILSKPELLQYLPEVEDRNLGRWWWVRTPGSSLLTASIVYNDGTFYRGGVNVNSKSGGVRPAMWVLLRG